LVKVEASLMVQVLPDYFIQDLNQNSVFGNLVAAIGFGFSFVKHSWHLIVNLISLFACLCKVDERKSCICKLKRMGKFYLF